MPAPVIGLSCYLEPARWGAWELPAALVPQWYLDLFTAAGAVVVLLPPGVRARGRSTGSTAWRSWAEPTSTRRRYGAEPHETADVPAHEPRRSPSWRCTGGRASGACPCWASAAACRSWPWRTAGR